MKKTKLIPVENLHKDIAKQPNEFTSAIFRGSAMAYKLIIFALYRTVSHPNPIDKDKKNVYCGFSRNQFCEKLGIPIGSKTMEMIKRATDELSESFLTLENIDYRENENKIWLRKMPWFQKVDVMMNGDVCLKFNQEIADFFEFKIGYTALELLEIGNLRSFFAMRYYSLAKSKAGYGGINGNSKNEWWFELTEDDIKKLFEIEKGQYTRRQNFVDKVIKNPCEEINEKTGINIELQYQKISKGNYKWRFICSNKAEQLKIAKTDSYEQKQDKRAINEEEKFIAEHQEEFDELFRYEKEQPSLFGGEQFDMFCRANAYAKLKEKYPD